eukprot:gb/GEZN01007692.1/.p1 GENE.gb/GEZN01007692.1/~~gb/GEZN01007692.1/.p1  ORF type:complete len:365 (-),score=56.94 gb/GEZN01007692.1/:322-1416(-)
MSFAPGDRVLLDGLSKEEFNGQEAFIVGLQRDSAGQARVAVQMPQGQKILVRPGNIKLLSGEGEEQGEPETRGGGARGVDEYRRGAQEIQLPSETDISTALLAFGYRKAKQHKAVSFSWVFGLLLAFLMYGFAPTADQEARYRQGLGKVDQQALWKLEAQSMEAQATYHRLKGWFSCDRECERAKEIADAVEAKFAAASFKANEQLSAAKSEVGLWSTYGVGEVRDLFWKRFGQGQGFAKRQSMWDALFMGMSMGRDETLVSFIVRLLIQLVMNLTIGLIGATVAFLWSVWAVIKSYQPSGPEALVFFGGAALAAISFVASWLIGLYLAGAGTIYVIAKTVANSQRLEGGPNGGQRRRVRMHAD